ncbi:Regulator of RNase E activity RraA [Quadrisphaera granulorum]|uniref:Putative 4-hydroxy-4-methyl-2-oxoglutarate aldolase n=1 Tax=Quadrisphaera granulorum TaxID=317664 RepID=A0A315ZPN2_9ACTN|nr:NAD(P)-binding domain-containing protein [Quadrisphaera granulorum]PWJ46970.1 regulator of RNase E activity RraA [Quadrisphaera granulorum]SZE98966.1 Regulator of RNase E activity RraA [Quadrisphaera granulorum]
MSVALLGLGEAGTLYAHGFVAAGLTVTGFDPADVPTPDGVVRCASVAEALDGADVVLGLTGARHARAVLEQALPHLRSGAVVAEMNSAAPQLKRELADLVAQREGVLFADVAVVGSVPEGGARTALVVAGTGARVVAERFGALGAPVEVLDAPAGAAAQRKLLRSVFMKGLGAIIVEALAAGEAAGDGDWVRAQVAAQLSGGTPWMDRLASGTVKHGLRRSHECEDAAAMLRDLGLTPTMTAASADLHRGAAHDEHRLEDELLRAYAAVPVANIGDALGRTNVLAGRLRAVWPGARVVGRALPVFCRKGENPGITIALDQARPGDVLVVDGQGDTDRALMGELIAERALSLGVRGMVIDGAVRDADVLQEMGFPVWAVGTSPAGPYKNGPGWAGRPVSVGGVVVNAGDLVAADGDGVVVVPAAQAERTLAEAQRIQAWEEGRRAELSRGRRTLAPSSSTSSSTASAMTASV